MGHQVSGQSQKNNQEKISRNQVKDSSPGRTGSKLSPLAIIQRAAIDLCSLTPADVMHLQRAMGNKAVSRLFEAPEAQLVQEGEEVIQRKIGMELQTDAVIWASNNKQYKKCERRVEDYGYKIFDKPGMFHIESDDGEVEFVTEAFEEDQKGLSDLLTAVSQAALFAGTIKDIVEQPRETWDDMKDQHKYERIAKAFGGGSYTSKDSNKTPLYIGTHDDIGGHPDMTASPQASAGIRLEQIQDLYNKLSKDKAIGGGDSKITYAVYSSGSITTDAGKEGDKNYTPSLTANRKLQGLVTLMIGYLRGAFVASPELPNEGNYPKMAHPMMARNNFRMLFSLLNEGERSIFIKEMTPKKLIAMAGLGGDYTPDTPIYSKGYISDKGQMIPVKYVPTVVQWWDSIVSVEPQYHNKDSISRLPGQLVGRGMGQLGVMDKRPKTKEPMPVFELRSMEKSVPFDKWVELAFQVFKMIHSVNDDLNEEKMQEPIVRDVVKMEAIEEDLNEEYKPKYYGLKDKIL